MEVHVVGEIVGASGFGRRKEVFCKVWEHLEGLEGGQSQAASGSFAVWSHPIDLHFLCKGLSGWPKLHFQVWQRNRRGQADLCGYGFCHVPTAAGMYQIECPSWAPQGTLGERIMSCFTGATPRLREEQVVYEPGDRYRLQTAAAGTVHLHLGVVLKDMDRYNVTTAR